MLTGFMGTGKSTVGRRLAKAIGFGWVDTDRMIEDRHGPIPEIFARAGESVFRGIERNVATELATRSRQVISTGGRMLLDADNIRTFSATGRIFSLTVEPQILVARLLESPTPRPLLAGPDPKGEILRLLAERQRGYARFTMVRSGVAPPEDVAAALTELVTTPSLTRIGRRGHAVLGDATTGLSSPIVVVSDETITELHAPCLGPVHRITTDPADVDGAGSVIYLGGTSVTANVRDGEFAVVVAPTTPAAMERPYPDEARVIVELATLQTLPGESS